MPLSFYAMIKVFLKALWTLKSSQTLELVSAARVSCISLCFSLIVAMVTGSSITSAKSDFVRMSAMGF